METLKIFLVPSSCSGNIQESVCGKQGTVIGILNIWLLEKGTVLLVCARNNQCLYKTPRQIDIG